MNESIASGQDSQTARNSQQFFGPNMSILNNSQEMIHNYSVEETLEMQEQDVYENEIVDIQQEDQFIPESNQYPSTQNEVPPSTKTPQLGRVGNSKI